MTEREAQERVAFEEWAKDYVKGMDSCGAYTSPYTMIAWQAWQASAGRALSTTPVGLEEPVADATLKECVTPKGLRARADQIRKGHWQGSDSTSRHLELAADALEHSTAREAALVEALEAVATFKHAGRVGAEVAAIAQSALQAGEACGTSKSNTDGETT